jgi:hypothetical protein
MTKVCKGCLLEKDVSLFYVATKKGDKTYYRSHCRECSSQLGVFRRISKAEYQRPDKKCSKCHMVKPKTEFPVASRRDPYVYYRSECKLCMNKIRIGQYRRARAKKFPHYYDVIYDYKVARQFMDMSHSQALEWLCQGYPDTNMEQLREWKLSAFKNELLKLEEVTDD